MVAGLIANGITGLKGTITIPGLGSTAAELSQWSLSERREEVGSDGPIWTLRVSFSFQVDFLLTNDMLKKKINLEFRTGDSVDFCSYEKITLIGRQAVIEGVRQCPRT